MLTAIAILALGVQPKLTVADFFPSREGDSYVYEENYSGIISQIVDTMGPTGSVGRFNDAFSISTKIPDLPTQNTYYRIEKNDVQIVAYLDTRPLSKPMIVVSYNGKKLEWNWSGIADLGEGDWNVKLKGKSLPLKPQTILGTEREILQVDLNMEIAVAPNDTIKIVRQDTYAAGLGLVATSEKAERSEFKVNRTRKLLSYAPRSKPK